MPDNITELVWYFATLFGSGMLVTIWWAIRTGFGRMIAKLDILSDAVQKQEVETVRLSQQLNDHIGNVSIHVERRV